MRHGQHEMMRHRQDTLERVRSMMRPGNPVPADAFAESWQDAQGLRVHDEIVALAAPEAAGAPLTDPARPGAGHPRRRPGGPGEPGGWSRRRQPGWRWPGSSRG